MSHNRPRRERAGLVGSFVNVGLRRLYAAEVVSGAGDGVFWVALLVFVSDQPSFGLWLTLAVVARLAPRALLSMPAGSVVDRTDIRSLVVTVEFVRAGVTLVMAAVVAAGGSAAVVLVLVALSYTIGSPTRPALSAMVPSVAGERHLAVANAVLSTLRQIMTFVGPLLGALVAIWSPALGFAINGATFAVSAVLIRMIPGAPRSGRDHSGDAEEAPRRSLIAFGADSLRAVRDIPTMSVIVGLVGVMYFVRGAEMVLHVYVVRDQLDADVDLIGLLGGAIGLGALISMPLAARAAASDSPVRPVLAAIALTAVPTVAIGFIAQTVWTCVVLIAVGVGMVLFEVVIVVLIQRATPQAALGRVFGAVNGASNAGKLVGAVAAPGLVALAGLRSALAVVALAVVVGGAMAVRPLVIVGRRAAERRRELAPRVRVLELLDIFDGAPPASLERIAADIDEEIVPAGTVVIDEGAEPDDLFITRRGRLDVTIRGRHLDVLERDDWFGEIGLIDRRPRTATVTALDDSIVWRIPGDTFLGVLEESGAPASALLDGMADRLAAHRG